MSRHRQRIVIFSHSAEHTTGRYFARVLEKAGGVDVEYRTSLNDVDELGYVPDLFLYVDPAPGHWPMGIERLDCPTACYLIDVHQHLESRLTAARFFDYAFIAQRDYVSRFSDSGIDATWLPLAADPDVHHVGGLGRDMDVAFVGQLGPRDTARHEILSTVIPRFRANDFKRTYTPAEMGRTYSRAKIVFNASINGDLNMRVFEAMASGALLITDRIDNGLDELFEEGKHYVGYSSIDEAIDKIREYLLDEASRIRIAAAGHQEVVALHCYAHRWASIGDHIKTSLRRPSRALLRDSPVRDVIQAYCGMFEHTRQPGQFFSLFRAYGISGPLVKAWLRTVARWLNQRVPLTPGAIRSRLRSA